MMQRPTGFTLRLDEKLCNTLVNSIRGIVWEADALDFRFYYVSPQAELILGYPTQQWLSEADFWRSHIHPEDVGWCTEYCLKATQKREDHEFEYRMIAADGRVVWLHDIVTVIETEDGDVRLRGIMIDITEAKLIELKLHTGEERFRLAMQGANDGIWDWDLATDEIYYSPRWKSMLGYAENELKNQLDTWSGLVHPADRDRVLALVRDYIEGRIGKFETEFRIRHKDGHYLTVLSRAFLARKEGEQAMHLVGTHVDLTSLRQAEEELFFAKACLDQAPLGFLRFSPEGRVVEANDHICRSLGYSHEELCSMSIVDFNPEIPVDDWSERIRRIKKIGTLSFETIHHGKNGIKVPMEVLASWLEYRGKEFFYSFEKDITERKKAEQQLKEQEELYRSMVDHAPDGIVLVDVETLGFQEFNDVACESLGYSREEFAGLTVPDINTEFSREQHYTKREKILARGKAVFETLHRCKDGSLRNMRISLKTVRIRERQYFLGFWIDITERVRLHAEMQIREHYQRALLDNFPYAVWMKNEVGQYLAVNRKLAEYQGVKRPEDMVGQSSYDFLETELANRIAEKDRRVLMGGRTTYAEEQFPVRGELRWFEVYQSPVTIDGRVIGTVGCNWDITERKLIEQELKESEERYRMLVELSPDSIFIHRKGRFVYMNVTGALLLGAERPEDLYGREVLDFVHPDYHEEVRKRILPAPPQSKNPPVELVLLRTDKTTVPVEMVSVHFHHRNANFVLAVARDISERKRMQDELVKAQRLESLGVLAGGIAHDFNNILTGILGNISLMLYQIDPAGPLASRLASCEKAAIRASELTHQLLTFARGGAPVRKLMDPSSLIRESATFVLRGSQIGCEIDLAEDLWSIRADAGQISQVLHNILINAMQAMPNGGVITIAGFNEQVRTGNVLNLPAGDYLHLEIKDQGCGIAPENLPKIFDPYFSTKPEGTGLGLASVYSVIKRHGGAIDVSSTVGVGSIFTLFLPAAPRERPKKAGVTRKNELIGAGRILLMDDEQIVRDIATMILETAGFQVENCNDGTKAVDRYRQLFGTGEAFDLVIMDLTVPGGMGGKEAAKRILEIDPNAVMLVASGYSNDPVIADFQQFGFKGAVVKPFSATTLVSEVRRLI